jgi:hypothetical protein
MRFLVVLWRGEARAAQEWVREFFPNLVRNDSRPSVFVLVSLSILVVVARLKDQAERNHGQEVQERH